MQWNFCKMNVKFYDCVTVHSRFSLHSENPVQKQHRSLQKQQLSFSSCREEQPTQLICIKQSAPYVRARCVWLFGTNRP